MASAFRTVLHGLAWLAVALGCVSRAAAQDESLVDEKPAYPVLVVNAASVDRLLGRGDFIFELIERPEFSDLVSAKLADFRDLKGIDREAPAGLMIFLGEGLAPFPIPVAYIPVTDVAEFGQTLSTVGAKLSEVPGEDGYYELQPERGPKSFAVLQDGYLFIGQNAESVDRLFASPREFAGSLSNRYDVCASANLRHTPEATKKLLLGIIRNSSQAGMQQRDGEPEGAYRMRRAQSERQLHFVENLLTEGEEATIGLKVDPQLRLGEIEFVLKAKQDSGFAREIAEGSAQPSYFAPAIDQSVPLSFSLSAMMNEFDRKRFTEMFDAGQIEANRGLAELPRETSTDDIPELQSVRGLFDSLRNTVKEGHLDGFVQIFGEPPEKFVLIGGVRLIDAPLFAAGLSDILERAARANPNAKIETAVSSHGDVVFHRLSGPNDRGARNTFGESPSVYVGAGNQAVWIALGGEDALPTLRAAMDRVATGRADVSPERAKMPFEFVMNMNHWVQLRNSENEEVPPKAQSTEPETPQRRQRQGGARMRALATQAFETPGSDVLRVDGMPIEDGFRVRARFENGFLRLIGLGITGMIDRSQDL